MKFRNLNLFQQIYNFASFALISFQYNLNEVVRTEVKRLFENIIKCNFVVSKKLETRDFVHIYDFQKVFLYKSIRRLTGLVKMKQFHYWDEKRCIAAWQQMGIL